jgi:membrane fusion protein (multidrug efflux system)
MFIVSIAFVIALMSAGFILDSVLYEHTDDAHVDGRITPLSAPINGQIHQVNVIEGQLVHAGDVLTVMDQKDHSIAVCQALANLAYAENTAASLYFNAAITVTSVYGGLNSAQAGVKTAEAEVVSAEQKLLADEAVLQQIRTDAAKTDSDIVGHEQLVSEEDISRKQHDSAPATPKANQTQLISAATVVAADQQVLLQAQGKLLQATTNLNNAQTGPQQVSLAKAKAQAADSQVLQRKAQLEQAQLNLNYTIIRSPVTGIVGKRRVEVGQHVSVGQELIDVVSLDDLWITANFKETQLGHLRPGQPVEIKVDAYGRTWKGHITNLCGGASSVFSALPAKDATGNHANVVQRVPVRIDFDRPPRQDFNAEGLLKPGLSVKPEVRVRWLVRAQSRPNRLLGTGSTPQAFISQYGPCWCLALDSN